MLVLGVFQAALWWHAVHLADAAANRGALAAATADGTAAEGVEAARSFAMAAGAHLSGPPAVARAGGTVTATVTVRVPLLLPGFPGSVARTSVAPVERFMSERDR